jgi:hypothetical protein
MAGKLIDHYHMQKVPQEGCWFSLCYSTDDQLDGDTLPVRYEPASWVALFIVASDGVSCVLQLSVAGSPY